jgi:hypothetical protein
MAQRDEGLLRLESFIAVAAETRIGLQREAEKMADLSDEIEDLGGRMDAEMKDLGSTAREFDARYGPIYEEWLGMSMAVGLTSGSLSRLGTLTARMQRSALIAAADALAYEYEHFPERRQQAAEALDQAAAAASDAFEQFQASARVMEEAVEPLSESLTISIDGLLQVVRDNVPEN